MSLLVPSYLSCLDLSIFSSGYRKTILFYKTGKFLIDTIYCECLIVCCILVFECVLIVMCFCFCVPLILLVDFLSSSAAKESACSAGDPASIPASGRFPGEGIGSTPVFWGFPGSSDSKESTCNVGDLGSVPGLGRSPRGGHGNPLQYSCLESPHGQRSLVGFWDPLDLKQLDTTEWHSTVP